MPPTGSNIAIKLKLVDSQSSIEKKILEAIKAELDGALYKGASAVQRRVRQLFKDAVDSDPTWNSIKYGDLRIQFGLPDAESRLDEIMNTWINTIDCSVKFITGNSTLRGGISIGMLQTDWQDVLGLDAAKLITDKGSTLEWLNWLLTFGDKIIITEYNIRKGSGGRSRTGGAIMIKKKAGRWRVPPEYSGTSNNNFITRILDIIQPQVDVIMEEEFTKRLA